MGEDVERYCPECGRSLQKPRFTKPLLVLLALVLLAILTAKVYFPDMVGQRVTHTVISEITVTQNIFTTVTKIEVTTYTYTKVLRAFKSREELGEFMEKMPYEIKNAKEWFYTWGEYGRSQGYRMGNLSVVVRISGGGYINAFLTYAFVDNEIYWINLKGEIFPAAQVGDPIKLDEGIYGIVLGNPVYD
jgi:hypothetical protein